MDLEQFDSGAVRDTQAGKVRYELITPTFKKDLAAMLTDKAEHYGDRNWEKGIPTARTFSSLLRHVEALGRGEYLDEESGHPHAVLAAANLMFIHEFHGTEFDTLNELVGPALRNRKPSNEQVDYPEGSLIYIDDVEPNRSYELEDSENDKWWYDTIDGGWTWDGVCYLNWDEVKGFEDAIIFPMVRVK